MRAYTRYPKSCGVHCMGSNQKYCSFHSQSIEAFTTASILEGHSKTPGDSKNAVSTLGRGAKSTQTSWGHTWGTPDHSAGSDQEQRRRCGWWDAMQPSQQQQLTGLQCPWSGPAGQPTSSQAAAGKWRPKSPSGGPSPPTARGACLPLHNIQNDKNKNVDDDDDDDDNDNNDNNSNNNNSNSNSNSKDAY